MDDWEPYHQDERDKAVKTGGYAFILTILLVLLVIMARWC